jgi:taurine transport system permease protein
VSDGTGMAETAPVERPVGAPAPAPGERSNKVRVSRYATPGEGSSLLISSLSIGALVLLWWLATHLGWVRPLFLPKPEAIWVAVQQAVAGDLDNHTLWVHIGWSLLRVVSAFALAAVLGIPIGLAMGMSRMARGIFDPPIEFYRPLPPLAYLPLMIIWFGIGELSKVLLIFLACFAPVALAARAGVRSVSQEQINAALSMGASRLQVIRHVVLLSALPEILVGLRIGMGVGWTTLVAAEMVAATAGLGQMVLNASNFLRTDVVVMGIICIGLFAYAFEMAMRRLERWLVPWKGRV